MTSPLPINKVRSIHAGLCKLPTMYKCVSMCAACMFMFFWDVAKENCDYMISVLAFLSLVLLAIFVFKV